MNERNENDRVEGRDAVGPFAVHGRYGVDTNRVYIDKDALPPSARGVLQRVRRASRSCMGTVATVGVP